MEEVMTQPTTPPAQSQRPDAPPGLAHANEHNSIPLSLPANGDHPPEPPPQSVCDARKLIEAMASMAVDHSALSNQPQTVADAALSHAPSWLTVNHG
jgi:hypothetical protein